MFDHEPDLIGADAMWEEVAEVGVGISAGAFNSDILVAKGSAIQELPPAVVFVVPTIIVDFGCRNVPKAYRHVLIFLDLVGAAYQENVCVLVEH